jgi:hypothetical protein
MTATQIDRILTKRESIQDRFRELASVPVGKGDENYWAAVRALGEACDVLMGCSAGTHNAAWAVPRERTV